MKKNAFVIAIVTLMSLNSYSNQNEISHKYEYQQTKNDLPSLEKDLITAYKAMQENSEKSESFTKLFFQVIHSNPKSIDYNFNKLKEQTGIYIATSTDKKLRIYSWDNNSGGTMRFFDQIIQFNTNSEIKSYLKTANEDSQSFISKIYSTNTNNNETIYLTINNSIFSTKDVSQSIFAYNIKNNKLNQVKVFKTKKQQLSSIHCEYDFFSVVDRPERPIELITLNNKVLNIPLITEKGKVTNQNLIYVWNGEYFIYKGIK